MPRGGKRTAPKTNCGRIQKKQKDPNRFYCPWKGCNRSTAELWRLKVHYRAQPDSKGSGVERGHGCELSHCPRCGQRLEAGKHHIGCRSGLAAPRQALRRELKGKRAPSVESQPCKDDSPAVQESSKDESSLAESSAIGTTTADFSTMSLLPPASTRFRQQATAEPVDSGYWADGRAEVPVEPSVSGHCTQDEHYAHSRIAAAGGLLGTTAPAETVHHAQGRPHMGIQMSAGMFQGTAESADLGHCTQGRPGGATPLAAGMLLLQRAASNQSEMSDVYFSHGYPCSRTQATRQVSAQLTRPYPKPVAPQSLNTVMDDEVFFPSTFPLIEAGHEGLGPLMPLPLQMAELAAYEAEITQIANWNIYHHLT